MGELSDIVANGNPSLSEKVGLGILFGSTPLATLGVLDNGIKIINHFVDKPDRIPLLLPKITSYTGDFIHIAFLYWLSGKILGKNPKIRNSVLALASLYYTAGELFNSYLLPSFPQILPGTPDPMDVPAVLAAAVGLYLANRNGKFQYI